MSNLYLKSYLLGQGHYDKVDGRLRWFTDEESDLWSDLERQWRQGLRKSLMSRHEAKNHFFPRWRELQQERNPERLDKENIRSKIDMVELYRSYFPDRKMSERGRRYRQAQCCFHGEDRMASLSLDTELKRFNCFACNEKGDCFDFVMKVENVGFRKAIEILNSL